MGLMTDAQAIVEITKCKRFSHADYYGGDSRFRKGLYVVETRHQSFTTYIFDRQLGLWFGDERSSEAVVRPDADVQWVTPQDIQSIYDYGGYVGYCMRRIEGR